MKTQQIVLLGLALSVPLFATVSPDTSIIDLEKSKSAVQFLAVGSPSAIKIRGTLNDGRPAVSGILRIEADVLTGSAVVLLDEFDTGMSLRNKHMKEKYLETQKWPTTRLVLSKMNLPQGFQQETYEAANIPFEGLLSLHGVEKRVSGVGSLKKKRNELRANFEFKFPLAQFGIETPTFMGVSVTQDVTVTVAINSNLASRSLD